MAAHSVTVLCDMSTVHEWDEDNRNVYKHAMDFAPAMDELHHQDWEDLRDALDSGTSDMVQGRVLTTLYKQLQKWLLLEKPRTHEEWVDGKHCTSLSKLIIKRIREFHAQCQDGEYTDTGDAWELLYWIQENLEKWGI